MSEMLSHDEMLSDDDLHQSSRAAAVINNFDTAGIGTYDGDVSSCNWCKGLSDSETVSDLAFATELSTSATTDHPTPPPPCLALHDQKDKWHFSAIGCLKGHRTSSKTETDETSVLHYLCVSEFGKLNWDRLILDVLEGLSRPAPGHLRDFTSDKFGPY
jgi:hypothetical protein